jgi:hypothetical protein
MSAAGSVWEGVDMTACQERAIYCQYQTHYGAVSRDQIRVLKVPLGPVAIPLVAGGSVWRAALRNRCWT